MGIHKAFRDYLSFQRERMSWQEREDRNVVEIASPALAKWARSMELVDLKAKFLLLELDLRAEIVKAVENKDTERADALEQALLGVGRAAAELK